MLFSLVPVCDKITFPLIICSWIAASQHVTVLYRNYVPHWLESLRSCLIAPEALNYFCSFSARDIFFLVKLAARKVMNLKASCCSKHNACSAASGECKNWVCCCRTVHIVWPPLGGSSVACVRMNWWSLDEFF